MTRSKLAIAEPIANQWFEELRPKLLAPPRARYAEVRQKLSDLWDDELALIADERPPSAPERVELTREAWERCAAHEFISIEWLGDTRTRFTWPEDARDAEAPEREDRPSTFGDWPDRALPMSVQSVVAFAADAETIEAARALCRVLFEASSLRSLIAEITSKLLRIRVDRASTRRSGLFTIGYGTIGKELFAEDERAAMLARLGYPPTWSDHARLACVVEAIARAHEGAAYQPIAQCAHAIRALFGLGLGVESGQWSKRPGTFLRITLPLPTAEK